VSSVREIGTSRHAEIVMDALQLVARWKHRLRIGRRVWRKEIEAAVIHVSQKLDRLGFGVMTRIVFYGYPPSFSLARAQLVAKGRERNFQFFVVPWHPLRL